MFSLVFVSLLAGLRKKTTRPIFTEFSRKVTHGPQEKKGFWRSM